MPTEVGATTQSISPRYVASPRAPGPPATETRTTPTETTEPPLPASGKVDRELLEKSVASVQDHIKAVHRNINFEVDDASGDTLVKVVDPESGDLIRQLPPESIVATAKILAEMAKKGLESGPKGLLLEAEA